LGGTAHALKWSFPREQARRAAAVLRLGLVTRLPVEVVLAVRRGEEHLVVHRSPAKGAYWHCISGALEPGETPAEAAARELEEETGLVATPVELDAGFRYSLSEEPERLPDFAPGTTEIVVHAFLVDAPAGWEPRLDHEHDGYRWCTRDDAVELLYWPEPKQLLRDL
jgi:lipoyl(octanoyl) transferase